MVDFKKTIIPVVMTFVFTLIVSFIMWNKTIDYNERENVIKSIEELRESKASKIELRNVEIETKAYTDKELSEFKAEIKGDLIDLKQLIKQGNDNDLELRKWLKEYIDVKTSK